MLRTETKLVGKQFRTNAEIHDSTWIHMKFQESLSKAKETKQSKIGANIQATAKTTCLRDKLRQGDSEDDKFARTRGRCRVCGDDLGSDNSLERKAL
eukprot:9062722-Karenia_brevis.AAC.1